MNLILILEETLWSLKLHLDKEMIGTYLNERNISDVSEAVIKEAVRAVQEMRLSVRFAASRYGMSHNALHYRIKKISKFAECNRPNVFISRYKSRQIFNVNQDLMLLDYVIKCSKLNYGMTYKQFRQLAYDCGRRLQSKFPSSWIDNKIA